MDETEFSLEKGEVLPETDRVYRIVLTSDRDRKNKAIPAVRCFDLSPNDENKLSVDWERKTTPEECIARVGASYKFNSEEYKPYLNREIFALDIEFLNDLEAVQQVEYDPISNIPPTRGAPDNPSHSLVVYHLSFMNDKAKRPETLLKIRNHAKDNKVSVDSERVEDLVRRYREG